MHRITALAVLLALLVNYGLLDFAGAGASIPLTGFGALLAKGVREAVAEQGLFGAFSGGLTASAAGIAMAIFAALVVALLAKSKDKS